MLRKELILMLLPDTIHFLSHAIQSIPHISTLAPSAACAGGTDPIGTVLQTTATSIQNDARIVGGIVFIICVIVAGIMRMIAFGSERRVAVSNMALTAAVVGLGIVILSPIMATTIAGWVGGAGCSTALIHAFLPL